ncbi:hypothetical protein CIHG_08660 [Coccidioides immitis H538.4]|uniref:Uncharacterized protein n=1 Tax=Coccidioides immitis H538.4 TaxID=396776 RepID=A0A0J8S1Z9_COCIT|nr:hypothetical protein CIHG_08660 [Coccidioides immitis H538.4]
MSPSKSMNEGYAGDANLGSNQRPPRLDGESLSRSKSWRLGTHDHIQLSTSSSDPLGAHRSSTSLTSKTSKIRTNGHYGSANTHYRSRCDYEDYWIERKRKGKKKRDKKKSLGCISEPVECPAEEPAADAVEYPAEAPTADPVEYRAEEPSGEPPETEMEMSNHTLTTSCTLSKPPSAPKTQP